MELSHLRAFVTLYRAGSVTLAAEQLHVTQPAMSRTLRAIEAQVGYRLFERSRSGLTPTAPAAHLFESVAPHYDTLRERLDDADGSMAPAMPVFVFGPSKIMPRLVQAVIREPNAPALRIEYAHDDDTTAAIVDGRADIGILVVHHDHPSVEVEPLFTERFDLVAAPAVATGLGLPTRTVSADALAEVPLLAFDEHATTARVFWNGVFQRPLTKVPRIVVNDLSALRDLAIDGAGMAVLPHHVCSEAIDRGELVPLIDIARSPVNIVYLAWRPGASASRAEVRLVRDVMRTVEHV
jgi:DNA-binding transcriptional LysR family regulator